MSTDSDPQTIFTTVALHALPDDAFLQRYASSEGHTDCYVIDIGRPVTLAQYVEAFYTTPLFKIERNLLALLVHRPSTDAQARALADNESDTFSAWTVEARQTDQLLMRDISGRTRSWLMSVTSANNQTRLFFGSAIVPVADKRSGQRHLGFPFAQLLGFHRLYSKALLRSAARRLSAQR